MAETSPASAKRSIERQRWALLRHVSQLLEIPIMALSVVWLGLLVKSLLSGLSPFLTHVYWAVWAVFVLDFLLRLFLAPRKLPYLERNWLTALSLFLPALRSLRFFTALSALRGVRVVQLLGSLNRGMRALSSTMQRRGFGYAVALTIIVTFAGAAGMEAFEGHLPNGQGLHGYGDALWWTAMIMTTMGSAYWPETADGRILGFLLALYALAVFGYITATLSSYFIGRDAASSESPVVGDDSIQALRREIAALRTELRTRIQDSGEP